MPGGEMRVLSCSAHFCLSLAASLLFTAGLFTLQSEAQIAAVVPATPMQLSQPLTENPSGAPITITLEDALSRARKNDAQYLTAIADAQIALEDRVQARSALLPQVTSTVQYLGTQGNGVLPSGRFV